MVMKILNKLKRIGYATSLREAMDLNKDDCEFNIVNIQISQTPKKSTYYYLMTTRTSNLW